MRGYLLLPAMYRIRARALCDRRFTAKDRGYDKADDGFRELSIDITPPWQMTQRNAAIAASAREKGRKGRRIGQRISRTARFLPRARDGINPDLVAVNYLAR
jgi:hypothetical protein